MFTRKQHLSKECTHREYYAQFVNEGLPEVVARIIGADRILNSTDPKHFNDIKLIYWDMCQSIPMGTGQKMKEHGDYLTMAGKNCILKEAAKQFYETSNKLNERK